MSNSDINLRIANNLKKYMDINNITQDKLADFMGVSQVTVSNWCNGVKLPRMNKIDKICNFFNINRSDLMDTEDDYSDVTNLIHPSAYRIPIIGNIVMATVAQLQKKRQATLQLTTL